MGNPVFAVVAHSDDWQLFMGQDMYDHIRDPHERVVIVHVTAGDGGRQDWYWKARENGAILSVVRATAGWSAHDLPTLIAADRDAVHALTPDRAGYFDAPPLPSQFSVCHDVAVCNDRALLRCTVASSCGPPTVMYFLHLADGAVDGRGFGTNERQSLRGLAAEPGAAMTAKWAPSGGRAAVYDCWADLIDTLHAVVTAELGAWDRAQPVWVHTTVDDETNAGDHSDHRLVGRIVRDLNERCFAGRLSLVQFYGYVTQNWDATKNDRQRAALYGYAGGFIASIGGIYGWADVWEREYASFGGREYWQDGTRPAPGPPCGRRRERTT